MAEIEMEDNGHGGYGGYGYGRHGNNFHGRYGGYGYGHGYGHGNHGYGYHSSLKSMPHVNWRLWVKLVLIDNQWYW